MKNALIENIVRLHTTELGAERICVITVNAGSYTIITAHREK